MSLPQYIPVNPQEHDTELRVIINKHMGLGQGNPSQWVVNAMHEVWQRAFGMGFQAGVKSMTAPPPPPPAFRVHIPAAPAPVPAPKAKAIEFDDIEVRPARRQSPGDAI